MTINSDKTWLWKVPNVKFNFRHICQFRPAILGDLQGTYLQFVFDYPSSGPFNWVFHFVQSILFAEIYFVLFPSPWESLYFFWTCRENWLRIAKFSICTVWATFGFIAKQLAYILHASSYLLSPKQTHIQDQMWKLKKSEIEIASTLIWPIADDIDKYLRINHIVNHEQNPKLQNPKSELLPITLSIA